MSGFNKRKYVRKRKVIPRVLSIVDADMDSSEPSPFVSYVRETTKFPPLMMKQPWTKAVPFKDCFEYCTPSESIGCSYTPTASRLNIRKLPPQKKIPPPCPIPREGPLGYPPKELCEMITEMEKERKIKKAKESQHEPGFVTLQDLLSGEYWKRKEQEKRKKRKIKPKPTMCSILTKMEATIEDERKKLNKLQAELPIDPDDQRNMLLATVYKEQNLTIRQEDAEKIEYYLTNGASNDDFEPYPMHYLTNAKRKIPQQLQIKPEYDVSI